MTTQTHTKWTVELVKSVAYSIFTDMNLNPGKNTTKALVEEITKEIGLTMTTSARKLIWDRVQMLHQSQIVEGRALKKA